MGDREYFGLGCLFVFSAETNQRGFAAQGWFLSLIT
jgi:hypothetical protein